MSNQEQHVIQVLADTILSIQHTGPVLIGVSGKDGSGKTYLSNQLASVLRHTTYREVIRISIDDFMNERVVRKRNRDQATGCYEDTFNLDVFEFATLGPLRSGVGTYVMKAFDHESDTDELITSSDTVPSDAIVIIDGVFLYQQRLNGYWNLRLQLEADESVLIERGSQRDATRKGGYECAVQAYRERYMPSQQLYYKKELPLDRADVVIDVNKLGQPVIISGVDGYRKISARL